ncbi:MAG: DUF2807 domain-containing protein [Bacteroidales bacterium]|nr:DUF2807 domain-containing protein [Bacteroidales bacterium]
MKNIKILLITAFCLSITACIDGQPRRTVYGNNNVVKKERQAGNFDGIRVSSGIDVYLSQGDKESIVVEADENLHGYIVTENKGGILNVYSRANIREAAMKRVYVTMRDLNSLTTSSAGDIIGEMPVRGEIIELSASSAGNIKLELTAREVRVNISSSGDVTLAGETEFLGASLSSAGDLNAYNLKAKEANISASSAGDASIYVTERLTARASSAGDINYKGNPGFIDAHSSSAGSIQKR